MDIKIAIETRLLAKPFRTSGHVSTHWDMVVVEISGQGFTGRSESQGVFYNGETPGSMKAQIEAVAGRIGPDRAALEDLLPAGGARNAVDCALWDWQAKVERAPAWELAGLDPPRPLLTTYTIGADTPQQMASDARAFATARALKLKLVGNADDAARVRAVRQARPDVWLGVDANQGFTRAFLEALMPVFTDAAVELIEQPFPIGKEQDLEGLASPIRVAADESAQTIADLPALVGRFEVVNIKLDKCGGLTHGLAMAHEARRLGLDVMVGNMGGTSLSMAPAFLMGQLCDIVDLDGPVLLARDRDAGATYDKGLVWCPETVWGGARPRSAEGAE